LPVMNITSSQVVITYEENKKIALELGASLIELERRVGGKLITLTVPEVVPPDAPRVMLQASDFIVSVGFSRLEISSKVPGHVAADPRAVGDFVQQICERVLSIVFSGALRYQWSGILWGSNYPMPGSPKPSIELIEPVFDKLVSVQRGSRPLAAFQLQFGFFDDSYFTGYTISGYEFRTGSVTGTADESGVLNLKLDQLPIKESGLQIITDVNNQRRQNKDPLVDVVTLLARQIDLAGNVINNLSLQEFFK
jgi:hypothetical protein